MDGNTLIIEVREVNGVRCFFCFDQSAENGFDRFAFFLGKQRANVVVRHVADFFETHGESLVQRQIKVHAGEFVADQFPRFRGVVDFPHGFHHSLLGMRA